MQTGPLGSKRKFLGKLQPEPSHHVNQKTQHFLAPFLPLYQLGPIQSPLEKADAWSLQAEHCMSLD